MMGNVIASFIMPHTVFPPMFVKLVLKGKGWIVFRYRGTLEDNCSGKLRLELGEEGHRALERVCKPQVASLSIF